MSHSVRVVIGKVVGAGGCVKKGNNTMQKQRSPKIQLCVVAGDKEVNCFVAKSLRWLGFDVDIKRCLPSAAQWVEFPFIRTDDGSFYGAEGIATFIRNAD